MGYTSDVADVSSDVSLDDQSGPLEQDPSHAQDC